MTVVAGGHVTVVAGHFGAFAVAVCQGLTLYMQLVSLLHTVAPRELIE